MLRQLFGRKIKLHHFSQKTKNRFVGDQDGEVAERKAHFLPQIYQKYIYTWNDSQSMFTEDWEKTLDFWKGKKASMWPGRR